MKAPEPQQNQQKEQEPIKNCRLYKSTANNDSNFNYRNKNLKSKGRKRIKEASQQQDRQTLQSSAWGNQFAIKARSQDARKASKLHALNCRETIFLES